MKSNKAPWEQPNVIWHADISQLWIYFVCMIMNTVHICIENYNNKQIVHVPPRSSWAVPWLLVSSFLTTHWYIPWSFLFTAWIVSTDWSVILTFWLGEILNPSFIQKTDLIGWPKTVQLKIADWFESTFCCCGSIVAERGSAKVSNIHRHKSRIHLKFHVFNDSLMSHGTSQHTCIWYTKQGIELIYEINVINLHCTVSCVVPVAEPWLLDALHI